MRVSSLAGILLSSVLTVVSQDAAEESPRDLRETVATDTYQANG